MTTLHKSYAISSFKARPDEGEGTFEAIVSVIGNVDLQGDRVISGAFEKSLQKWKASGDPIPILWSHEWGDPFAHIGYADPADVREVRGKGVIPPGLLVKGHLDVHKPFGKQVFDLLSERRVKEWSFSYDIPPGGEKRGKDGANELHTVDIIELGPTLKGANPATVSLGTKSDEIDEESRKLKLRLDSAHDDELKMMLAKAEWDGAAAMRACKNAADFRKIAFERANDSDPDTAAHWALPHHPGPDGAPGNANPAGVAAALAALHGARGGAPDLKNKSAAESHLKAHGGGSSEEKGKHGSHDQRTHGNWAGGGSGSPTVGDRVAQPGGGPHTYVIDQQRGDESHLVHDTGISAGWHPTESLQRVDESGEHITESGAYSSGTPEQEREAQAVLDELLGTGLLQEDVLDEVADPTRGAYDAIQDLVAAGFLDEETLDEVRRGLGLKKSFKAGRVIGAKAAAALKDALTGAVDEWAAKMNGTGDDGETAQEKEAEPGDKKDFARGYADGSTLRPKADETNEQYLRGYEEGSKERLTVEQTELSELNGLLSGLEIKK